MSISKKLISVARAKELQAEWEKTRNYVTTNGNRHQDTCEFHFKLEELQEYLDYVKSKSEEKGIKNPGINIWLGAYEATEEKPNLTTIFLTATKEKDEPDEDALRDYLENEEIQPMNVIQGPWPPGKY